MLLGKPNEHIDPNQYSDELFSSAPWQSLDSCGVPADKPARDLGPSAWAPSPTLVGICEESLE
jgi:hypothetical protein